MNLEEVLNTNGLKPPRLQMFAELICHIIFGFPYNRGWKGIAGAITAIKKFATVTTYGSNEKYRLTKYYIRDLSYVDKDPDIYVYIYKTQNLVQAASTHPAEIPLVTTGDYEIYLK